MSNPIKNWKRLAGKAFIRYGNLQWPDPYEPISCIPNNIYRKHIKLIFDHGEEIFIGRETMYDKVKNTIHYFDNVNKLIPNMLLRNKSALIIQNAWDICRYDPSYIICKKILIREYDDLFN